MACIMVMVFELTAVAMLRCRGGGGVEAARRDEARRGEGAGGW
jgi:hypothetical protein